MKKLVPVFLILALFVFVSYALSQEEGNKVKVKKVQVDSNFDGKVDRTEYYDASGNIEKVEIDSSGDGKPDEWIIYQGGKPVKSERDSNGDGKPDVWIDY